MIFMDEEKEEEENDTLNEIKGGVSRSTMSDVRSDEELEAKKQIDPHYQELSQKAEARIRLNWVQVGNERVDIQEHITDLHAAIGSLTTDQKKRVKEYWRAFKRLENEIEEHREIGEPGYYDDLHGRFLDKHAAVMEMIKALATTADISQKAYLKFYGAYTATLKAGWKERVKAGIDEDMTELVEMVIILEEKLREGGIDTEEIKDKVKRWRSKHLDMEGKTD
jgi:hypothetical protein